MLTCTPLSNACIRYVCTYITKRQLYSREWNFGLLLPPILPEVSFHFNGFSHRPLHVHDYVSYYIFAYLFLLLKKKSFCLLPDPRVGDWWMMSNPFPTLIICLLYAYFSKVLGPKLMENRKPFDLRGILIMYNLIQTLFSAWIFYEVRFFYVSSYHLILLTHL